MSFVSVPIYTSLLSPYEFGRYSLIMAAVAVADAMCFQWMVVSVVRFLPRFRAEPGFFVRQISRYFSVTLGLVLLTSLLAILLLHEKNAVLISLGVFLLSVTAWNELNLELARSRFRVAEYAIAASAAAVLGLGTGVLMARAGMGERAPVAGSAIALFVTGCGFLIRGRNDFLQSSSSSHEGQLFQSLLSYGGPMAVALLVSSLLNASDRFLINHMLGPASVGIYSAAWSLVFPAITILGSTINLAGFPQIIHGFESQDPMLQSRIQHQLTLLVKILVPAAIGTYILSGEIARVFLGSDFSVVAASLLPGLALVAALSTLRSLYTDLAFHLEKKSSTLSLIMLAALLCSVSLNFLLLPRFGVRAAVWSALAGYSVALLFSVVLGRKLFKLPGLSKTESIRVGISSLTMVLVLKNTDLGDDRVDVLLRVLIGVTIYFLVDWIVGLFNRRPGHVTS